MNELQAIVAMANRMSASTALAMATVVRVEGSTYRRPGARMLLAASGETAGMISGGCIDADVRERALRVMASGKPCLVTYDSTSPDDVVFGLGLGCNGVVQILIEPVIPPVGDGGHLMAFLAQCRRQRRSGRIATVLHAVGEIGAVEPGARLMRWPDGAVTGSASEPTVEAALRAALDAMPTLPAQLQRIDLPGRGRLELLVETISPPVPLVICGAGDDAIPLARCADLLGWHVAIVDARPAYALPERFPAADLVRCLRPEDLASDEHEILSPDALVVVMTHNYLQDRDLLRVLLPRSLRYIGVLGPKARTERLLDELSREESAIRPAAPAALYSPAGLDLGAETPDEIALSVVAEMQAVLANRRGGSLRDRPGGIHAPFQAPAPQGQPAESGSAAREGDAGGIL